MWEIDRSDIADASTIPGDYSTDVVTSVATSAGSEGEVEVSFDTEVEGTIISGEVNVTPELLAILQLVSEEQEFVQPMAEWTEETQATETQYIEEDEKLAGE